MVIVPVALVCEALYHACGCASALAATRLAIEDANHKDGSVISDFGSLTKNVTMKLSAVIDPYTPGLLEKMVGWWSEGGTAPAAIIGSYYSSQTRKIAQVADSYKVAQVAWVAAPDWKDNPIYPGVLRLNPTDYRAAVASYRLLEKKNISHVALIADAGDTWSAEMVSVIEEACKQDSHRCHPEIFFGETTNTDEFWHTTMLRIKSQGIRTIINFYLLSELEKAYRAALLLSMVGPSAAGYMMIVNNYIWSFPAEYDHLWRGTLKVLQATSVKPSKEPVFRENWRQKVPGLKHHHAFVPLSSAEARDPSMCSEGMWMATQAYDSVGRVRMALENVNFSGLLAHPDDGEAKVPNWYGSEILKALQEGTTMDGVVQGDSLRKSPAVGLPWIESREPHAVYNYIDADNAAVEIYSLDPFGKLAESAGLSRAKLPGNLNFKADAGTLLATACNSKVDRPCRSASSFGTCVEAPIHLGSSRGWCSCDAGYVGKYCNYRGFSKFPPIWGPGEEVLVHLGVMIQGFDQFDSNGKAFNVPLQLVYTWEDPRFPWEDSVTMTGRDEYNEVETDQLLEDIWAPEVQLSGGAALKKRTLKVKRNGDNVTLSLTKRWQVHQDYVPDFREFPFDRHPLSLGISTKMPVIHLVHDGTHLVAPGAKEEWNAQWSWDEGGYGDKWADLEGTDNNYQLNIRVARAYNVLIFRLILPIVILAMTSWAAFWIPPSALMPRFASGFIAFLALQPFKAFALSLMPNDGNLNGMSWVDVFISVVGLFMGCAVLETVTSQYIANVRSQRVSRQVDICARWAFPFAFLVFLIIMSIKMDVAVANVVVHVWFGLFVFAFAMHAAREFHYAMPLLIRRSVRPIDSTKSLSERYRAVLVSENELHSVFDLCNTFTKNKSQLNKELASHKKEKIGVRAFAHWLETVCPVLKSVRSDMEDLIGLSFGDPDFDFPAFKSKFCSFLVELNLLVNADDYELQRIRSAGISRSRQSQTEKPTESATEKSFETAVMEDEEEECGHGGHGGRGSETAV